MDSIVLLLVLAGAFYLAWEFCRQIYDAGMHGTIRTGRSNRRVVRREQDPALFRNNLIAAIALFGLFFGLGIWMFMSLVGDWRPFG